MIEVQRNAGTASRKRRYVGSVGRQLCGSGLLGLWGQGDGRWTHACNELWAMGEGAMGNGQWAMGNNGPWAKREELKF